MNDKCREIQAYTVTAGTIVIRVAGDVSGDGAFAMRRTLASELTGCPDVLILDLSAVKHIDDEGVETLRSGAELAAEQDIGLALVVPPQGAVASALHAAESLCLFETFPSVSDALRDPP